MPPRKRAASAPKPDPNGCVVEPATEDDGDGTSEVPVEPQDSDDTGASTDSASAPAPDGDEEPGPERSDLQSVEAPCAECFPNGWPAQGYAVGCTHGTWTRETTD